jgi:hypothetical protein
VEKDRDRAEVRVVAADKAVVAVVAKDRVGVNVRVAVVVEPAWDPAEAVFAPSVIRNYRTGRECPA